MDLFADIKSGKFGKSKALKKESKHELKELGGEKKAEKYEKEVKHGKTCDCKKCKSFARKDK